MKWHTPACSGRVCTVFVFSMFAIIVGTRGFPVSAYSDDLSELETRLSDDIKYLASDELDGRGVGTKGLDLAADYVREHFQAAGLDVGRVDGTAFQKFDMVARTELGEPNVLKFSGPDEETIELQRGTDFQVCSFGGSGVFEGELVFAGYAIEASDKHYNDFAGINVKDKVAIIMRRNPQQGNPHGPFAGPHGGLSSHAAIRSKVVNALGAGAKAILLVNDPYSTRSEREKASQRIQEATAQAITAGEEFDAIDSNNAQQLIDAAKNLSVAVRRIKSRREAAKQFDPDQLIKFGDNRGAGVRKAPILHISQEVCTKVLRLALNTSLQTLETEIDEELKPQSALLAGWTARGETSVKRVRVEVKNVIGILEGEGPLADETIVVGAHYDHVGYGGAGSLAPGSNEIHNGADDNASGTVALIELARRLAERRKKLPRRVMFIAFTAEERGLIGSARYVDNPVIALDKTVAMFNMDMVGRLRDQKLTVFGIGTASRWKTMIEKLGNASGFKLSLKPEGFGPSDQTSFYKKQIPVLHFFTGTHQDYHRPGDDWEKINIAGMARIIDMIERVIVETADTRERPRYLEAKTRERVPRSGSRPYFGSIPDFGREVTGYAISGSAAGSPAAKAGLKAGDVIIKLGKHQITGLDDFDLVLRKLSAGDEVEVEVLRNKTKLKVKVTLAQPR